MIPPKPSKPNAAAPKKRQGRIHWGTPAKLYPLELIQHGLPTLLMADQLDYLTSLDVAKLHFYQAMTQKTANRQVPPHRRNLRQARNAANEMNLRRLKDLGLLTTRRVPVPDRRLGVTLAEVNFLSRPGLAALTRHSKDDYLPNWTPNLYQKILTQTNHDRMVHRVVVNLLMAFRMAGGHMEAVLTGDKLEYYITKQQTHLGDIWPDALLAIQFGPIIKSYLIEVDMGTEVVSGKAYSSFDKKIPRYGDYLKSRYPTDPFFEGWEKPQVLIVAPSWRRANNLKEATFAAGGLRSYAFTAFEFLEPEDYTALDAIWLIPTVPDAAKLELPITATATPSV